MTGYPTSARLISLGEIRCPKKGILAVRRCLALQEETRARGAACTCSVFTAYQAAGGHIPPPPPPDDASDAERQEVARQQRNDHIVERSQQRAAAKLARRTPGALRRG